MLVEAAHLADHHVERLLGAVGQVGAAAVEHLHRGGERGDGGAQLVADVAGEARLAFEAGLHRVGHVVERAGQAVEVGVVLRWHARVEPAGGDLAGGGRRHARAVAAGGGWSTSPRKPASSIVTPAPTSSAVAMARRLRCRCLSIGNASKYWASAAGMLMPTATYGLPSYSNRCWPLPPWSTSGAQLQREGLELGSWRRTNWPCRRARAARNPPLSVRRSTGSSNCLVSAQQLVAHGLGVGDGLRAVRSAGVGR